LITSGTMRWAEHGRDEKYVRTFGRKPEGRGAWEHIGVDRR